MRIRTQYKASCGILILGLLGCNGAYSQTPSNIHRQEVNMSNEHLRLNQLQYIGTHNSYHIAPDGALVTLMRLLNYKQNDDWTASKLIPALDFTHVPLSTQLELGMRQFELDVHQDKVGGKYSNPGALLALQNSDVPSSITYDPAGELKKPGFKVFHGGVDVGSTCLSLNKCLTEIKNWSKANPNHFPIVIHIEAKEGSKPALANSYPPVDEPDFDVSAWQDLEDEILTIFPKDKIILPEDVRGNHASLSRAIKKDGWPSLKESAGKVMFLLLNKKAPTNRYEKARPKLENQLFFTSAGSDSPYSAWLRVPDPDYPDNKKFIRNNLMITTQADVHTIQARTNDTGRREKAFTSGAHFILTDYAIPDLRYSDYQVRFGPNTYVRCNPVTFKGTCPF